MKISVHPLFFAAGIACALFGGLPIFLIYTLTALAHECGHIFCAHGMGFSCEGIKLMPYGAAAVCEIEGISPDDSDFRLQLLKAADALSRFSDYVQYEIKNLPRGEYGEKK